MKKICSVLLVVVLVMSIFSACGSKDKAPSTEKEAEVKTDAEAKTEEDKVTLIMATEPTFPPYNYMSGTDVVGIDADIAKDIAEEHGWNLVVEPMDFDAIIPSVKTGKADFGAAGISITEERKEQVDFTIEYATSVQVILVQSDSDIVGIEDLEGKKVGVQLGTVSHLVIADEYPDIELVPNKKYTDLVLELKNGKIDAIVLDNLPAQAILNKNEDLKITEEEFLTDKYAFAVSKENPELLEALNSSLKRLMDEGKIVEYTEKHLGN